MFDSKKLLDQLLGPGTRGAADDLLVQGKDMLSRTLGSLQGGDAVQKGTDAARQGVSYAEQKASEMLGSDTVAKAKDFVSSNQLAVGAAAGGLLALLLGSKTGRSLGGGVLKVGALAGIAGLAYKAYSDWQTNAAPPSSHGAPNPTSAPSSLPVPVPPAGPFAPAAPQAEQELARALLVAMIAAAKADGHVDDTERARIMDKLSHLPVEPEARAFVEAELAAPLDINKVAAAGTSTEDATQIYAASLLCIDIDNDQERAYLADLAAKLQLEQALVDRITRTVMAART